MSKCNVKLGLIAGCLALSVTTTAQNSTPKISNQNGSVYFIPDRQMLSKSATIADLQKQLGLNSNHSFKIISESTDQLGYTLTRVQQFYKGVKVENGLLLVHSKQNIIRSINGKISEIGNLSTIPVINENEAQTFAQKSLSVRQTIRKYPAELVIAPITDSKSNTSNILSYKVRIDARTFEGQIVMQNVFVDAQTGNIFRKDNLIHHADVNGTGQTLYNGVKNITMDDSVTGKYRLYDNARNIHTCNAAAAETNTSTGSNILYPDAKDYLNNTTNWASENALMEITLDSAPNSMITGLGYSTDKFISSFIFHNTTSPLDLATWPDAKVEDQPTMNLPLSSKNFYFFPEDTTYQAGWGKLDFSAPGNNYSFTDSVIFPLNNLNTGTHNWTGNNNTAGGTYTIQKTANPAIDAHWGMEKTYDFYSVKFGRNSYDGQGSRITNYVNGLWPFGGSQNNAMAVPDPYNVMIYGMGDGIESNAYVALDVMGHEFTHLVIANNGNGGLTGIEGGALNESFADIMGTSIEFFVDSASANWTIGEDVFTAVGPPMRSLSNPKLFQHPDTYGGQYWDSLQESHAGAGIQNKWFYLLTQGGSGTNDNGDNYNVTGIGISKAQQIVYRNIVTYITPTSGYMDAYRGSLLAAKDLYGNGSDTTTQEYKSVKDAWFAVGIPKGNNNVAVNNVENNNTNLSLYPNPATTVLNINSTLSKDIEVQIINIVGVQVMKTVVSNGSNSVDISGLTKGVYMVRYNTGAGGYVQKFTKL